MPASPNMLRGLLIGAAALVIITTGYTAFDDVLQSSADSRARVTDQNQGLKARIAAIALQEYDRWHANGVMRETDVAATPVLLQYWQHGVIPVTARNLRNSSWQYHHPWSAVFISHVMYESGAGDQFIYSNNHAKYIVWARENAAADPAALFAAFDVSDARSAWPEPGDLICMNRRNKTYTLASITSNCISHCDIVVEVNRHEKYLVAVGGNVGQTVSKRVVWLDENGLIDASRNWEVHDDEEGVSQGPQREIFAMIRVNAAAR